MPAMTPRRWSIATIMIASCLMMLSPTLIQADASSAAGKTVFGMYVHANDDAMKSSERMNQAVEEILGNGFTSIVVQARAYGKAYYQSDLDPRGFDDGLEDPLAAMIETARGKDSTVKIYASLQVLTAYSYYDTISNQPEGALGKNPDWVLVNIDGSVEDAERQRYLDPAMPGAREWIVEAVLEVVNNYDVDGIILEDLYYPLGGAQWGFSREALRRYEAATDSTERPTEDSEAWQQWRSDQLTQLLERITSEVKTAKPNVMVAAVGKCDGGAPVSLDDFKNSTAWHDHLQNWPQWRIDSTTDLIVLQNFKRNTTQDQQARRWLEFASELGGEAQFGVAVSGGLNFPAGVAAQMSLARQNGASVIVLHSLRMPSKGSKLSLYELLNDTVFTRPRVFRPSGIKYVPPEPTSSGEMELTTPTLTVSPTPTPETTPEPEETAEPTDMSAMDDMIMTDDEMETPMNQSPSPEPTPEITATPEPTQTLPSTTGARGDTLFLKNGQIVRGRFIDRVEGKIIFEQESGLQLNIPEDQVEKIERGL